MKSASPIWAILPIKSLGDAKQRLCNILSPDERRELMLVSARDVMSALSRSTRLSGILLVSKDTTALELGREYGVHQLIVNYDDGQSDAIIQAVELLRKKGVTATLTIPGDVPLVKARDIDVVCNTLDSAPSLTIVSNSDGTGSNCIAASPPDLIAYRFGSNSFARHISSARAAGVEPTVLTLPRVELDIDMESDIATLMNHRPRTATQRFLVASGIGLRCSAPRHRPPLQVGRPPELAVVNR